MTSVTGITAEHAAFIEASSVVSAFISASGDLILVKAGGAQNSVGPIAGDYSTTELRESVRTLKSFDTLTQDVTIPDWFTTGVSNTSVPLGTALPGAGKDVAWSPDGNYVAFMHTGSPWVSIYKIFKGATYDIFNKLPNPAVLPYSVPTGIAWSPDGQYLVVCGNSIGQLSVIVYKRAGDVFTKLTDPPSLPYSNLDTAWSPDGKYLALAHSISPFYNVYKRSVDTFTKLTTPDLGNLGQVNEVAWSNGGQYLVLGAFYQSFCILKRSGDTFTKLSNPATMPTGNVRSVCFSPNDQYLVVTVETGGSSGLNIYKRSGDVFTKLPNPSVMPPANAASSACWSPDGKYLVVTADGVGTPIIVVYSRTNDTFTSVTPLPAGLLSDSQKPSFSPDGKYLAMVSNTSPYFVISLSSLKVVNEPQISTRLVP